MALSDGSLNLLSAANQQAVQAVQQKRSTTGQMLLSDNQIIKNLALHFAKTISQQEAGDELAGFQLRTFTFNNAILTSNVPNVVAGTINSTAYVPTIALQPSVNSGVLFTGFFPQGATPSAVKVVIRYTPSATPGSNQTVAIVAQLGNVDSQGTSPVFGTQASVLDLVPTTAPSIRQISVTLNDVQHLGDGPDQQFVLLLARNSIADTYVAGSVLIASVSLYSA